MGRGLLKFKGDNTKKKGKKRRVEEVEEEEKKEIKENEEIKKTDEKEEEEVDEAPIEEKYLTDSQKKALKRQKERQEQLIPKFIEKTHRQLVEEFSNKLANLTEHNDVPRVSAAGNG